MTVDRDIGLQAGSAKTPAGPPRVSIAVPIIGLVAIIAAIVVVIVMLRGPGAITNTETLPTTSDAMTTSDATIDGTIDVTIDATIDATAQ